MALGLMFMQILISFGSHLICLEQRAHVEHFAATRIGYVNFFGAVADDDLPRLSCTATWSAHSYSACGWSQVYQANTQR